MLNCIEYACGLGGVDQAAGLGPAVIRDSFTGDKRLKWLQEIKVSENPDKKEAIATACLKLAKELALLRQENKFFCVLGGDHSSAIGTWSGVTAASSKPFGLIWIDAHMDAHTFATSQSQNIHGMPLAALLGYGDPLLTEMLKKEAKIRAENLHLHGIRSFEPEEKKLLEELKVSICYAEESLAKGTQVVLNQVAQKLSQDCEYFGVSLDLDAFDPKYAPAVSTPARKGLKPADILSFLKELKTNYPKQFVGLEITEFNPSRDKEGKTLLLVREIIELLV